MRESAQALQLVAFDADDTLWLTEPGYSAAQEKLQQLLEPYVELDALAQAVYETEMRNMPLYGYGAKPFILSMIETAIELSAGEISARDVRRIIDIGRDMLNAPLSLLPGARETLERLAPAHNLILITKGDIFDQEGKLARSGLAGLFRAVEIVGEKDEATYARILARHGVEPGGFLMVGNSLRSDVLPVLAIGGRAVHIPYHITWLHETVDEARLPKDGYFTLENIGQLPELLEQEFGGG
jgi:putative hydrolase of the HAD superfamily